MRLEIKSVILYLSHLVLCQILAKEFGCKYSTFFFTSKFFSLIFSQTRFIHYKCIIRIVTASEAAF